MIALLSRHLGATSWESFAADFAVDHRESAIPAIRRAP